MARTWAVSGVDLHLDLTGTRVRAALESALREAVRTGRLAAGLRLPSSRALSADLGIARNTVADAYGQLVAEGWLTALPGSGTRVAARPSGAPLSPAPTPGPGPGPAAAPPAPGRAAAPPAGTLRHDLRPGSPCLSLFPRAGWPAAARRALATAPAETLGYGHTRGVPALRAALAEYLARARGVHADPEHLVVCTGFTQALGLLDPGAAGARRDDDERGDVRPPAPPRGDRRRRPAAAAGPRGRTRRGRRGRGRGR